MLAARIHRHGGPEVIALDDIPKPTPHGEVLVDIAFAGVNFVDAYQREGRYPGVQLPLTLGIEAAGRIQSAPSHSRFRTGDRVAFAALAQGAYAQQIALADSALVRVPDHLALSTAACVLEQGLTADILLHDVATIPSGQHAWALVHAGAGGVGRWLVRGLLDRGIKVLALASSCEKRSLLASWGAYPLSSLAEDWPTQMLDLTQGERPNWVFDSVGATTFDASLAVLAERGHLVLYGAASGQVPPVDVTRLMVKSATLTRPVLPHYLREPDVLAARAARVFATVGTHPMLAELATSLRLTEVKQAHEALASRERQGKLLLEIGGE